MQSNPVRVWDPAVRLVHWSLAAAFVAGWLTQEAHYDLHLGGGYALLGLVVFRFLWGFIGPAHARFGDFLVGPRRIGAYLRSLAAGRPRRFLGHNPLGGLMVVALLAALIASALTGIALDAAENRAGPLGGTRLFLYGGLVEAAHEASSNLALALVFLHLGGVAFSSLMHRENLPLAMVTGKKACPPAD